MTITTRMCVETNDLSEVDISREELLELIKRHLNVGDNFVAMVYNLLANRDKKYSNHESYCFEMAKILFDGLMLDEQQRLLQKLKEKYLSLEDYQNLHKDLQIVGKTKKGGK